MLHPEPEEIPVVSATRTPRLPSADRLVDGTDNELFSFQQNTSETAEFLILFRPLHQSQESEAPPAARDQSPVAPSERLRVKLTREDDGRITVSSPQLDIASFGKTKSEAWEAFLAALDDLKRFYLQHKSTLPRPLLEKLRLLESPLDFVETE